MEHQFHRDLKEATAQYLASNDIQILQEHQLPNNKIADIIGIDANNMIIIVEVKTTLQDHDLQYALAKYGSYCHALFIACPADETINQTNMPPLLDFLSRTRHVGLLGVVDDAVIIVRKPGQLPLSEANRADTMQGIARARRNGKITT